MTSRWRKAIACAILLVVTLSVGCATMGLVETIESLLKQIKELLTAKKWDAALTKVAEVIRREPTEWRAYLFGAQAYIGKADWGQALTQARKAVELAPRESETLTTLAQSLFGAGTDALQRRAFGDGHREQRREQQQRKGGVVERLARPERLVARRVGFRRGGDAMAAHGCDVRDAERDQQQREEHRVHRVEARQCEISELVPAGEQPFQRRPDERRGSGDADRHPRRPVAALVPRQERAGEAERQ